MVQSEGAVFEFVRVDFLDSEVSGDLREIFDYDILGLGFSDEDLVKVVLFVLEADKRIFPNGGEFDHHWVLFVCVEQSLGYQDRGVLGSVGNDDFLDGVGGDGPLGRLEDERTVFIKMKLNWIWIVIIQLELILRGLIDWAEVKVELPGHSCGNALVTDFPSPFGFHLDHCFLNLS